jgi:hypothetical protein
VYPKIVTGKVQVAYLENVFPDWSIFKEAVLLSNQRFPNNSLYGLGDNQISGVDKSWY